MLRLAARRKGNASTVASFMHAIDHICSPRADSVMTDDPLLSPAKAHPSVDKIPGAALHEVAGGHGRWLEDPSGCAKLVIDHFGATGFEPAV